MSDAERLAETIEIRRGWTWAELADYHLAPLFIDGEQPTDQEIFAAYPFGVRDHWPYKVWLKQVKWWRAGCPAPKPARADRRPLPGQERFL